MTRASEQRPSGGSQDDPGESNDPQSSASGWESHIWSSVNSIFERLGKMDQKLDQIASDQIKLKSSVEKHDKLILRVTYTVTGAAAVMAALWFAYEKLLKDHIHFT